MRESEAYAENLASSDPAIYLVLRKNDNSDDYADVEADKDAADVHVAEISLSPYHIQDYEDCGEDQVEKLQLQGPIAEFVGAVAKHFQPEPFKKRKRDKAHVSLRDAGRGDVRRRQSGDVFQTPTSSPRLPVKKYITTTVEQRNTEHMAKPTNPESGSLIDRFNRRREKVAAEARSDQTDEEHLVSKDLDDTDIADEEDALSDSELLKKYELPDPETVEDEAALDQFFEGDMPERLKRLALRRVWRLNPLFRFADEMVEYGEDYTDAATVVEGMQTAYEVGKGYLAKVKEALEGDVGDHDVMASETSSGLR